MSRAATGALVSGEWLSWSPERKRHALAAAQAERARRLRALWEPYPWQRPHEHPIGYRGVCTEACFELPAPDIEAHDTVLMLGGRGTGKTDGGSEYVLRHIDGPVCDPRAPGGHRIAIVAPTLGDAASSCVDGLSGLKAHDPRVILRQSQHSTFAILPGGARARLFGANTPDDVNRLRAGGNTCLVWLEEAAAMRYLGQVLEHTALGLRVGPTPHYFVSTTPRARAEVRAWLDDETVHVTRGRTRDAVHLEAAVRTVLERKFAGTTTGRQELDGETLQDIAGALWKRAMIDPHRVVPGAEPAMRRVVVAVDPNAGGKDECGIVVVGLGKVPERDARGYMTLHGYVLEDASGHFAHPGEWATKVVQVYRRWAADAVVAEINNGGDMVPHTVRTVDPSVPVRVVTATRGKVVRAEPVVSLYEAGRMHHVGTFPELEDQQCEWTEDAGYSPDRMDGLVWGATDLLGPASSSGGSDFAIV